ncbi:MAG: hypothetical protein BMS9Abin17_1396 [Acidimicrobiia bacterium]|nr:MAG: hypothetical protein BMS9Abin17_1396 [Acidimicrobiia bacterium]
MRDFRTSHQYVVLLAGSGGVLFILGGLLATRSQGMQIMSIATGGILAILTLYALGLARQNNNLTDKNSILEAELDKQRQADESLRTRMTYTLRDPLTSIVGFADRMSDDAEMPFDQRREIVIAIRDDAREVEKVLSELAYSPTSNGARANRVEGVVLLDEEVRSVASTMHTDVTFESDLAPTRSWGDSAHVRQILRTILNTVQEGGCAYVTLRTEQRPRSAVVTISGRDDLAPVEAIAALTGNTEFSDALNEDFIALKAAHELAGAMGGTIGYAQAFGMSHIVIDFPAAPDDLSVEPPPHMEQDPFDLSFSTVVGLRPERPTTSIRFV